MTLSRRVESGWRPGVRRWVCGCAAVAIFCVAMMTGCSGRPPDIVTGRVTYRSDPVAGGRIYFNVGAGASVQSAEIAADGSYTVTGLTPGLARVAVTAPVAVLPPGGGEGPVAEQLRSEPVITIPRKYGSIETSGIEVRVEPGRVMHDISLE